MKYQATKTALRNLILNAIDNKYIKGLKHEITSYTNASPYDLLTYIWSTYGNIDDADHTLKCRCLLIKGMICIVIIKGMICIVDVAVGRPDAGE